MSTSTQSRSALNRQQTPWVMALALGLLVALIAGIFTSAFIWPIKESNAHHIPLGISGPKQSLTVMTKQLNASKADMFDISTYNDRAEIVHGIKTRSIEGGVVLNKTGVEVLTASAGNTQVTQILNTLATGMKEQQYASQEATAQQASTMTVTTTDVVKGSTASAAGNLVVLPALIAGIATAMMATFIIKRPLYRIITLFSGAILGGLTGAAVLGPWFDVLPGSYGMHALALGMGILAIGSTVCGLASLLGKTGLGLGMMLMMLIGNPWGGMLVPTEFLPGFMGWIGSHMPNGNVITLMKNISFFPEASQSIQWWTFVAWAIAGILMLLAGAAIQQRKQKTALALSPSAS